MIQSIAELVTYMENHHADKVAFRWLDDDALVCEKTYAEYTADVRRFAAFLHTQAGVTENSHVALLAANSYHFAVAIYGILLIGAAVVPLNNREQPNVLQAELSDADVDCFITNDTCVAAYPDIMQAYPHYDVTCYQQIAEVPDAEYASNSEKPAILMFTSGTTGKNKCVELSYKNYYAALELATRPISHVRELYHLEISKAFVVLPLYHIFGMGHIIFDLYEGMTLNLCLNMRNYFRDIALMNSDWIAGVPLIVDSLYRAMLRDGQKNIGGLKLIVCGGAKMNQEQVEVFRKHGIIMVNAYGMTETFTTGTVNTMEDLRKIDSIGKPETETEIRFDDGELCMRSDAIAQRYYKNPEESAQVFVDGWMHTGDMGYMDGEGYIFLTGRKKNLIILSSGENVSPEELEGLVCANANVKEIVVKEKKGKICAEIYCDEEKQEEIRRHITEVNCTLAIYKRMTLVEFRTEPFPRTSTGKIQRC